MKALHADEVSLVSSLEGLAAFRLLLPLLRALALHIAGRGKFPEDLATIPDLKSDVALERARYRALRGQDK
jgi:hypothetical protein